MSNRPRWIAQVCVALLTLAAWAGAQSLANPYDAELAGVQVRFARATEVPAQAVALRDAWRLRDYVNDAAALERWIASVAAGPVPPLVRRDAQRLLAEAAARRGHFAEAEEAYRALGFVQRWRVAGPGSSRRDLESLGAQPYLRFGDLSSEPGTYVAASAIEAETEAPAVLRIESDAPARVWINDEVALAECAGECAVGVYLRAGRNRVQVEVRRDSDENARVALQVSRPDGDPLPLAATFADALVPAAARAAKTFAPVTLAGLAQESLVVHRNDARRMEVLAKLEAGSDPAAAREHMEEAARRQRTAENWLELARIAPEHAYDALQQALRTAPADARVLDALAQYYAAREQPEKARDLLLEAVRNNPGDFVARKHLADLWATAGRDSLAASEYRRLERDFPSPLWLRRELAARYHGYGWEERAAALAASVARDDLPSVQRLMEKIAMAQRDGALLRQIYVQEAAIDPNNSEPVRQLAALDAGPLSAAEAAHGVAAANARQRPADADLAREFDTAATRYLVDGAKLAADARAALPPADADEVMLANVRVERVLENGLSAVRQQEITYLASEEAARHESSRSVQYSPENEDLAILHARAYKPDGRVLEAEDEGDSAVADASVAMYYDVRARALRFPGLEKGDVVELDYRVTPRARSNPYGNYFGELRLFRGRSARRLQRWVLMTPADRRFAVHEERMPGTATVMVNGATRTYDWQVHNAAALAREPRGPAATALAPYVHVSTFASWEALGHWYADLIRPQFALDASLRQALARALAGRHGHLEKIQAIRQLVLRDTHYVAFEFGVFSYKPYPVAQVYARRFGDCKDKASLMIALLRAAGIDADIALVRTRSMGPIAGQAASISVFNHAIAYLPKYDLWLDGTAEYAGLRELPLEDQGAMALTVSLGGDAQLRQVPVSGPADNFTRRVVRASVAEDGSIHFSGTNYTRGEEAPALRREYQSSEAQREAVRSRLVEMFSNVRIDDVNADTALERDVNVSFRGQLDTFTGHAVVNLAASWTPRSFLAQLAPLTRRSTELVLATPWTREEELRFELPRGAEVTHLPPDMAVEAPFGTARLSFMRKGRQLTVRTLVNITQTHITAAEYPEFRDFCSRLERAFRQEVTVSLRPMEARR